MEMAHSVAEVNPFIPTEFDEVAFQGPFSMKSLRSQCLSVLVLGWAKCIVKGTSVALRNMRKKTARIKKGSFAFFA